MTKRIICLDIKDNLVCFQDNRGKLFVLDVESPLLTGKTFPCPHCGKEHSVKQFKQVGDYVMCPDCFSEDKFFKCTACGEYHLRTNMYQVNSQQLCGACFNEKYYVCSQCGKVHEKAGSTVVGNERYCQHCTDMLLGNGELVECSDCGTIIHSRDAYEHNDNLYCPDCYEQVMAEECEDAIAEYHDGRDFRFKSLNSDVSRPKKGNLYLGLEQELSYAGPDSL